MGHLILVPAGAAAEVWPQLPGGQLGVLVPVSPPGHEVRAQLGTWLAKPQRPRGVSSVYHSEHHNTLSERTGLARIPELSRGEGVSGAGEEKERQAGGVWVPACPQGFLVDGSNLSLCPDPSVHWGLHGDRRISPKVLAEGLF